MHNESDQVSMRFRCVSTCTCGARSATFFMHYKYGSEAQPTLFSSAKRAGGGHNMSLVLFVGSRSIETAEAKDESDATGIEPGTSGRKVVLAAS